MKSSIDTTKQKTTRSRSPEELVEESYEVVSTLTKPHEEQFLTTASSPKSKQVASALSTARHYVEVNPAKATSSEDDSSYCEEWTVTEAKRKQDGQTVQTVIDRYGSLFDFICTITEIFISPHKRIRSRTSDKLGFPLFANSEFRGVYCLKYSVLSPIDELAKSG
jgi:hypothetical protein